MSVRGWDASACGLKWAFTLALHVPSRTTLEAMCLLACLIVPSGLLLACRRGFCAAPWPYTLAVAWSPESASGVVVVLGLLPICDVHCQITALPKPSPSPPRPTYPTRLQIGIHRCAPDVLPAAHSNAQTQTMHKALLDATPSPRENIKLPNTPKETLQTGCSWRLSPPLHPTGPTGTQLICSPTLTSHGTQAYGQFSPNPIWHSSKPHLRGSECPCTAIHVFRLSAIQYLYNRVQYNTVQYSTVQYSTVQHSTVQYSTVQYSTVQYSTVQYSTVQYSTVQYSTVQYSTVQYSTVQYSTVQYSTYIRQYNATLQCVAMRCYAICM